VPSSRRRERSATCTAFDGSRTRFFDIDAATQQVQPLALVDGRFHPRADAGGGWIDGWWDGRQALVHPATHCALQVAPHDGAEATRLAIGDTVVAAVSPDGDGSVISVSKRD
jgi:hypothetical protein